MAAAFLADYGMSQTLQKVLSIVVATGWLAIVLVPLVTPVDIDPRTQVGVMGAMSIVLGAVFGVQIIRKNNGEKG